MAAAGRIANGVIIATQDAEHAGPAITFTEVGCQVLLEKPMATGEADAVARPRDGRGDDRPGAGGPRARTAPLSGPFAGIARDLAR